MIARDEANDPELAVEKFNAALDDAPFTPRAFDAIDKLLTDRKDWKNLARAYRRQLKRMGDDASADDPWFSNNLGRPARKPNRWTKCARG